jgi:hypothetical protein
MTSYMDASTGNEQSFDPAVRGHMLPLQVMKRVISTYGNGYITITHLLYCLRWHFLCRQCDVRRCRVRVNSLKPSCQPLTFLKDSNNVTVGRDPTARSVSLGIITPRLQCSVEDMVTQSVRARDFTAACRIMTLMLPSMSLPSGIL